MQLSAFQRQFLEIYRRHHVEPPTEFRLVGEMMHFQRAWKTLLAWIAVAIVAGLGYYSLACFLAGVVLGGVAAHLDNIIKYVQLRPLIETYVDWSKVDELLSTTEPVDVP